MSPAYSADGKKIVFDSRRTGTFDIFVMNTDGTGRTNLTKSAADDRPPPSLPTAKDSLSRATGRSNNDVFVMNADGTGQTDLTPDPGIDGKPIFSPDGNKIAF